MAQQALQGAAAVIAFTFRDAAGEPATVSDASVRVLRDDGTEIVPPTAPTAGTDGAYSFALPPSATALLDLLTAEWTATIDAAAQTFTTQIEVVGGVYFTVAEARRRRPLEDTTKYPAADIEEARALAERDIEDAAKDAFVRRYRRERISTYGSTKLVLSWPNLQRVRYLAVDGVALTDDELAALEWRAVGVVLCPQAAAKRTVDIAYEHGQAAPPGRIKNAALLLTKSYLLDTLVDDRAIRTVDDNGRETVYSAPGVRGIVFGIPEVQGAVDQYERPRLFL